MFNRLFRNTRQGSIVKLDKALSFTDPTVLNLSDAGVEDVAHKTNQPYHQMKGDF